MVLSACGGTKHQNADGQCLSRSAPENAVVPSPEEDIQGAWELPLAEIGRGPATTVYAAQQPNAAAARQAPVPIKTPGAVPGAPLQVPYLMPEAGPQHLYTGLLDIAPIQAVAYAPPPELPQRSLGYCALYAAIAALGAFMGLILFFLVSRSRLSRNTRPLRWWPLTASRASCPTPDGLVSAGVRGAIVGTCRVRVPRLHEAPTVAFTSEAQDEGGTEARIASSDGAAGLRSKETVRRNASEGRIHPC
ncbi:hypothetical protein HPB50_021922 [Hyalomma asiaticum]|uniref:Uncharacterized protein n=1 Tax=Hyalomma asiaticum TaxID=266040 RepID=A0ACB7T1J7_HYAAI|nr:hypothetical protein HPB50_021922 [Hyalomma asiaticum]